MSERTLEDFFRGEGLWTPHLLWPTVTTDAVKKIIEDLDTPGWNYFFELCEGYATSPYVMENWSAKNVCKVAERLCGDRTQVTLAATIAALDTAPTRALEDVERFFNPELVLNDSELVEFDYMDIYGFLKGVPEFSEITPIIDDAVYRVPTFEQCYEIAKQCPSHRYQYLAEERDCFMPDTPLWCKWGGGMGVRTVEEISEMALRGPLMLLDPGGGWQHMTSITSKTSDKPVATLSGDGGLLMTTSDHRVMNDDGVMDAVGTDGFTPLYSVDFIRDIQAECSESKIDTELAWLYGLFCADGYAVRDAMNRKFITITSVTEEYIERALDVLNANFHGFFKRTDFKSDEAGNKRGKATLRNKQHKIIFNPHGPGRGRRKADKIIDKKVNEVMEVFEAFYTTDRKKVIPDWLLTAHPEVLASFLSGYWDGNGEKRHGKMGNCARVTVPNSTLAMQIYSAYLMIGDYERVRIQPYKSKNAYDVVAYKAVLRDTHKKRNKVTKSRSVSTVYDISVENGVFRAGGYNVKNCDDYMKITRGWLSEQGYGNLSVASITYSALKDGVTVYGHAVNLYIYHIDGDLGCMLCEPQCPDMFWEPSEIQPGKETKTNATSFRRIIV